jgi:acetone carboxylase gamma subunit
VHAYCEEAENYRRREMNVVAAAVRAGLESQIPREALCLMRWDELETFVCGDCMVDLDLLQSVTEYGGGYSVLDPVIVWFWWVNS